MEAQTWKSRPSVLMGITDSYVAYCLDEAASEWGNHIRGKLDEVEGPNPKAIAGRQTVILRKLLRGDYKELYQTPVATATKEELAERGIEV